MTRLWDFLIDDSVKVLFCEDVIMAVKDDLDAMIDQEAMDWFLPSWAILLEFVLAIRTLATPFPVRSGFASTSIVLVGTAD